MRNILILFAHPAFHKSRINKVLINEVRDIEGVTFNNLYDKYPDFYIDVKKEQQLLIEHDVIIWHHPFYWYSAPAIIKEWMDLVLEHGFAYGIKGKQLQGKYALSVITTGGIKDVYSRTGRNQFTINEFLAPFQQSAQLCNMTYLPPFVVHGSHTITKENTFTHAKMYRDLVMALRDENIDIRKWNKSIYSNELFDKYA